MRVVDSTVDAIAGRAVVGHLGVYINQSPDAEADITPLSQEPQQVHAFVRIHRT